MREMGGLVPGALHGHGEIDDVRMLQLLACSCISFSFLFLCFFFFSFLFVFFFPWRLPD